MPYLIDSDWTIDHLDGQPDAVSLLRVLVLEQMYISVISYIEVYQGIIRSPDPVQAEHRLNQFIISAPILPVSQGVAQRCARIRESLRQQGRRTNSRAMDLIIAATALEHDLTLVTRNIDDFRDIPDLKIQR